MPSCTARTIPLLLVLLLSPWLCVAQDSTLSYPDAVRVLAREQSQAEGYAALLNTVAKNDVGKYARGIQLYTDAKAEFDGLLEQMKAQMLRGKAPEKSADFQRSLQAAVERRVEFTDFVSEQVVGKGDGQKGLGAALATAAELLPAILEAGTAIWKEFRSVNEARRQEILDQLESLKWKPFFEIVARRATPPHGLPRDT